MARIVSEESVQLIRKFLSEIDLPTPFDGDGAGYNILKFFEQLDVDIGGMADKGETVDPGFAAGVDKVIQEFMYDGLDPIDYGDLERRLKN